MQSTELSFCVVQYSARALDDFSKWPAERILHLNSCSAVEWCLCINPNWRQEVASHHYMPFLFFPLAFSDDGYDAENYN